MLIYKEYEDHDEIHIIDHVETQKVNEQLTMESNSDENLIDSMISI